MVGPEGEIVGLEGEGANEGTFEAVEFVVIRSKITFAVASVKSSRCTYIKFNCFLFFVVDIKIINPRMSVTYVFQKIIVLGAKLYMPISNSTQHSTLF